MSQRVSFTVPGPSGRSQSGVVQPGLVQPGDGQRLAVSLRASRLTTLYGPAGSGKSTLLQHDVLPMLHRRATDMAVPHGLAPRVVIPFADRRRGPGAFGGTRIAEVAVLFDDWATEPLPQLLTQVHEAMGIAAPEITSATVSLAGSLAALNMQFGARFLLIIDQFEEGLAAVESSPRHREFFDQLVLSLNRPLLPVNFLISVREESWPLLDELRARVPGFDDRSMHLGAPPEARSPLRRVPASPNLAAPDAAEAADGPQRAPADAELEWQQALGAIVKRAAVSARHRAVPGASPPAAGAAADAPDTEALSSVLPFWEDWQDGRLSADDAPVPARPAAPDDGETAFPPFTGLQERDDEVDVDDEGDAAVPPPGGIGFAAALPTVPARVSKPPTRAVELAVWVAAGLVFVAYGAWMVWTPGSEPAELAAAVPPHPAAPVAIPQEQLQQQPPAAAVPAPPSPTTTAMAPAPTPAGPPVTARALAGVDATPRPLAELASTLALASPAGAAAVTGWPAGFSAVPGAPNFAVARYDALQAARRQNLATPLQVLAPLYIEPIYFVVRADSPMTYIHDIDAAVIDAGTADSSRGVTAAAIYRRLFNKPLPDRPAAASGADAAIAQLLAGKKRDGKSIAAPGIDVVVLAGSQPSAWLASLPPATAKAVKVLKLDPNSAADQRALQAYLPTTLRAGPAEGTRSLAVMSFLVAADASDGVAGVKALCAALPALQKTGDPIWRELQPGLQLEAGWPASPAAQQAWRDCTPRSP